MCGICSSRRTSTVQDCWPRCRRDRTAAAVVRAAFVARAAPCALARAGHLAVASRAAAEAARSRTAARTGRQRRARRPRDCRDFSITSDSQRFASASSTSTGETSSWRRICPPSAPGRTPSMHAEGAATVASHALGGAGEGVSSARRSRVAGQHGDLRTFRVCCRIVRGFDLSDDEAARALAEWNARCEPPWSERELRQKVTNARRYGREPQGGLL